MAIKAIRRQIRNYFVARRDQRLRAELQSILGPEGIAVVDIGAAGGLQDRWKPFSVSIDLIAVEPDTRASESMDKLSTNQFRSLHRINSPLASTNRQLEFFFCKHPKQSSVLRPNPSHYKKYADGHKWEIVKTEIMNAIRLDDAISDQIQPDFMKLDTQGSELDILKGSEQVLLNSLGIEAEIEFREIYESQALFGDLSHFLNSKGFDFIDFVAYSRWERSRPDGLRTHLGELIHADALFLRSPESIIEMAKNENGLGLINRYLGVLFVYCRSDMMRATLVLAFESGLINDPYLAQVTSIVNRIDKRLHRYQSALLKLSGFTGWTDLDLRFVVVH